MKGLFFITVSHAFQRNVAAFREAFEGPNVEVALIGAVRGVYVKGVPDTVSKEVLTLFFENKKTSGGEEKCVDQVEFHTVGSDRQAVVRINSSAGKLCDLSLDPVIF